MQQVRGARTACDEDAIHQYQMRHPRRYAEFIDHRLHCRCFCHFDRELVVHAFLPVELVRKVVAKRCEQLESDLHRLALLRLFSGGPGSAGMLRLRAREICLGESQRVAQQVILPGTELDLRLGQSAENSDMLGETYRI